jgi:signal transduction histidine kinase
MTFVSVSLSGQADSLSLHKEKYYQEKNEKNYKAAYDIAYKIGIIYRSLNADSSYSWFEHCYHNSHQLSDPFLSAKSLSKLGAVQLQQRNYDASLIFTEKADSILKIYPNDSISSQNLYYQGEAYEYSDRPRKAMQKYLEAYKKCESIENLKMLIVLDTKFGNMKKVTGDNQEAIGHYKKAINRLDKTIHPFLFWYSQFNISNLIISNQEDFSDEEFSDACQKVNDFRLNAIDHPTLTRHKDLYEHLHIKCILANGSTEEINTLPLTSIRVIQDNFYDIDVLMDNYYTNFEISMKQQNYIAAEKYLNVIEETANNTVDKRDFLRHKKRFLLIKEDYKAIVPLLEKLHKLELKLDSDDRIESISNLEGVLKAKEKEYEVEVLNKEKELLAAKSAQNLTLALGAGLLAILAFGFFYLSRQNNKKIAAKNAEISEKNNQLEQANQTKDRIFAIIGHDLRKPAIAFSRISETINYLVKKEDYSTLQQLGTEIEKDGFALQKLTDNLLNWALTQRDVMPYSPNELSLHQKVEEILLIFEKAARDKNIELVNKIPEGMKVFADPNALLTILMNLVDNALKFTPKGGLVELEAKKTTQGVKILVSDNGVGMSEEQIHEIFLLQKDKSQKGTSGEKGTGLGLHLVNELVKMNKGEIEVKSRGGEGTEFQLLLPEKRNVAA